MQRARSSCVVRGRGCAGGSSGSPLRSASFKYLTSRSKAWRRARALACASGAAKSGKMLPANSRSFAPCTSASHRMGLRPYQTPGPSLAPSVWSGGATTAQGITRHNAATVCWSRQRRRKPRAHNLSGIRGRKISVKLINPTSQSVPPRCRVVLVLLGVPSNRELLVPPRRNANAPHRITPC